MSVCVALQSAINRADILPDKQKMFSFGPNKHSALTVIYNNTKQLLQSKEKHAKPQ